MDYLLRDIPDDIWRRAKAKATLEGFNMKQLLTFFLEAWAEDKIGFTGEKRRAKAVISHKQDS